MARWLVAGGWLLVAGGWFLVPSYKLLATSYLHTSRPAVISTAAQWSGEISLQIGAGRITVGDLSAQSINGALILLSSYRFRAPLEMTCEAGAAGTETWAEPGFPLKRWKR